MTARKRDVARWHPAAHYVAEFGGGACDVTVSVGVSDDQWFIRQTCSNGHADDTTDAAYVSESDARNAAHALARERNVAETDESAQQYIDRIELLRIAKLLGWV